MTDNPNLIYKAQNYEPVAQNATIDVKFSNDILLSQRFLDQKRIQYDPNDLEEGPWGLCLRIKRDKK